MERSGAAGPGSARRTRGGGPSRRGASAPAAGVGLDELGELLGGESDRSRRFLGGLLAGALAGAALAGLAMLRGQRRTDG